MSRIVRFKKYQASPRTMMSSWHGLRTKLTNPLKKICSLEVNSKVRTSRYLSNRMTWESWRTIWNLRFSNRFKSIKTSSRSKNLISKSKNRNLKMICNCKKRSHFLTFQLWRQPTRWCSKQKLINWTFKKKTLSSKRPSWTKRLWT